MLKVNCKKTELGLALAAICRVAPTRTNNPILNGCLLFTDENSLVIQGTDLEVNLTIKIPVQVEEEGCTVVTARYLSDLVRRLPGEDLSLSFDESSQLLDVNYNSAVSRLHTWPTEDFPPVQQRCEGNVIHFTGQKWKNYIDKVLFAAAQQEARLNYAGVYFQFFEDEIHLAATDAYRLALLKITNNTGISGASMLVPGRALSEVNKLVADGDTLDISWNDKMISFSAAGFVLTSRLISAQFPNYERVIPEDQELKITVARELLLDTLERATLFIDPDNKYAVASLKVEGDILTVSAQAVEIGSLKEEIAITVPVEKSCAASFNASYLLTPLQVMDQEMISLCLNGEEGPALYLDESEGESYIHLISPVCRVN